MRTLFRHIRKSFLEQNRMRKYFTYAIGEIILVVIGILIALQINNQNEAKKETKELHGYLKNIRNNITADSIEIQTMIEFRDSVKVYSGKALAVSQQKKITLKDIQVVLHDQYNIFYDQYLEINSSGFEALKFSGFLGKIQGKPIEKLLNDYYHLTKVIAKNEKSLNDFIENMEVLGFQEGIFGKVVDIMKSPDPEDYILSHQKEIHELLNHPSLQGANLRGTYQGAILRAYDKLLKIGYRIRVEIEKITND